MQQFIRYLYEYKYDKRVRNVGFIKVEKEEHACRIQMHGKGIVGGNTNRVEVFVLYQKEKELIAVTQGSIACENPIVHYVLTFEGEDVGGVEAFQNLQGICLCSENGSVYAASWDDRPLAVSRMKRADEPEIFEDPESVPSDSHTEETQAETENQMEEVEEQEESDARESTEMIDEEPEQYIPSSQRKYEKISRQDLSRLARCEWKLANNSFLLHGFYNYHHLLYIEEGENCWIGVPGIYHEKEKAAAGAFGFSQFLRITEGEVELSEEESNPVEDFGYWCRSVMRGSHHTE